MQGDTATSESAERAESPVFDFEEWRYLMDGEDITEEEKRIILKALWNILFQFVDLGFEIHPVQYFSYPDSAATDQNALYSPIHTAPEED